MSYLPWATALGVGATALADLWALVRRRLFRVPLPGHGLVGRWLMHMLRGRFVHRSIREAATVRGEAFIGWTAHYLIGICFAALLVGIAGRKWLQTPTPAPALLFGLATVAAPFLLMQPGMGAGIAASRTPRPGAARMQSLINHGLFGLGLYLSAMAARAFIDA